MRLRLIVRSRHGVFFPEWEKVVPLEGIAFDDGFEALGELCGAGSEMGIAFVMRGAMRTQRREAEEMIVTAWLAQTEDLHDGRTSDRRHHVAADGEGRRLTEKGNCRCDAAVGAITHHADEFAATHGGDELDGIGRCAGERDEFEMLVGRAIQHGADGGSFLVKAGHIDGTFDAREELTSGFPIADMRGEEQHTFALGDGVVDVLFAVEREGKLVGVACEDGGAVNQRATERPEMFEHEPAPFPPRLRAKDATVKIHRGRDIGRGEAEIDCGKNREQVAEARAEQPDRGDEKRDAATPAA